MTLASYLQAVPKVELNLQLEGAMPLNSLLTIARRNDIPDTLKGYKTWLGLLEKPDYKRLSEITRTASSWLLHADDLTRIVYDVGLSLAKQNVRYAEIGVSPTLYETLNLSFDEWLNAINDGRDRVKRAWGLEIMWILMIPRDDPRRADDVARQAASAAARKGGVVGFGVSGREEVMPVGQFEKAFQNAEKKELFRVARAGDYDRGQGVLETITTLLPNRLLDARGVTESPEAITALAERGIGVCVGVSRALKHGWIQQPNELALQMLMDEGVRVTVGTDMPVLYQTTLTDEYHKLVESNALALDGLEDIALNAVRASFLLPEEKETMLASFKEEYEKLREEHLVPQGA
jgi:adenosine deaminase